MLSRTFINQQSNDQTTLFIQNHNPTGKIHKKIIEPNRSQKNKTQLMLSTLNVVMIQVCTILICSIHPHIVCIYSQSLA